MPGVCNTGDQTKGSLHDRQALYQLSDILSPCEFLFMYSALEREVGEAGLLLCSSFAD